jgi:ribose transport system permease protein
VANDWIQRLANHVQVITLVLLVVVVGTYDQTFFAPSTLLTLMSDTMTLFLMAAGATLVILMGGIDLSVQSVASLASVVVAALVPEWGFFAIIVAVAAGCFTGLVGGLAHTWLKIPSFIATLAVSGLVISAAFVLSDARSIDIASYNRETHFEWLVGETAGIPHEIVVGLVVLAIMTFVERRTPFGRLVRAIGSGERAVIASGINADRIKLVAFTLSGALAGFAGVVMAGRIASGSPTLANEFLLPAIAAIVVGGTALTGGVGSVWRTFIGALIIAVVRIGMTFMGVSVFAQQIVFGVVLIAAVALTMDRSKVAVVK